jgi:MFS family permease
MHSPSGDKHRAGLTRLPQRLLDRLRRADFFATRGVPQRYHQGMKYYWLDGVFSSSSVAFYFNYIPLYALALGASRAQVGWLSSAASLLGMLAPIPGAAVARRLGKRKLMVVVFSVLFRSMLLLAALIPFLFSGQAAVYVFIGIMALRVGFMSFFNPAWVSLTGDVLPERNRGRFFASRNTVTSLASMLFVPIAGSLIDWAGEPRGYQISFVIAAVFGYGASYIFSRIPEPASQEAPPSKDRFAFWNALTGNRVFLLYLGARFFWSFVWQVASPYFRVYQVEVLGSSVRLVGLLVTVTSLSGLFGQRFWGRMLDRRGARWVMSVCTLLIPATPFIWIVINEPWQVVFVSLVGGFLWAGFNLGALNLLLELPDREYHTQSAAAHSVAVYLANIVAPLVGSAIIDGLGYHWNFALSGTGRMIAAVLFVLLLKPFGRGTQPSSIETDDKAADLDTHTDAEPVGATTASTSDSR